MASKVFIQGHDGRMGKEIASLLAEDKKLALVSELSKSQVIIDFSSPQGTMEALAQALSLKKPILVGTTGFSPEQLKKLKVASKKIPVFFSSNFSVGISSMIEAMQLFGKKFGPCEIKIEETHHIHKVDKPSGTALMIKSALNEKKLKSGEPISLREGEVFGIHKVYFIGKNEWVAFEHHAENRKVFAEGAINVAKWLIKKKPGYYLMRDFLNGDGK